MGMIGCFIQVTPATLEEILKDSRQLENIIDNETAESGIDVDKAWEAIHYLLTGDGIASTEQHRLSKIILGLHSVDVEQDLLGYGPAAFLHQDEVVIAASELAVFTDAEIKARYDGPKMRVCGIYPNIWDEESFEYLLNHFRALKDFYTEAAEKGNAIIMYNS